MTNNTMPHQSSNDPAIRRAVSNSRVEAFDFARGLAVIFMIMIHVLNSYGTADVHKSGLGIGLQAFVDWPSASVFVFVMGALIVQASKGRLSEGLKRAVGLFFLGYVLNFFRSSLPMWLSIQMGLVSYEQLAPYTPTSELFVGDIFQFAGLAYAFSILIRHYLPDARYWLAVAVLVLIGSPYLWDLSIDWGASNEFFKLLWGNTRQGAVFPFFPWITYCLAGMCFGQWLKQSQDHHAIFNKAFLLAIVLMVVGGLIISTDQAYHAPHHLRAGPGLLIAISGYTLLWMFICRQVVTRVPSGRFLDTFYFWGKNVTAFYIIHWLLIGWGHMLLGANQLNIPQTLIAMVAILVTSHFILKGWLKISAIGKSVPAPELISDTSQVSIR